MTEKMENIIELKVRKDIIYLAGNEYGYKIYKEQIMNLIDYKAINYIKIPDHIQKVAISFVQGLFRDILRKINKKDISDHFVILTANEFLHDKFISSITF